MSASFLYTTEITSALYMVAIAMNIIAIALLIPITAYTHLWLLITYALVTCVIVRCNICIIISYVGIAIAGRLTISHVAMVSG